MVRAAAKNFMSCAVIVNPCDYDTVLNGIRKNDGCTGFKQRLRLAQLAFHTTAKYESQIDNYMSNIGLSDNIKAQYNISEGSR
jgi:phosphoribosylaminoimidazolecarboxamide formyltransferase/IMP cyclohydrolase